MTSHLSRDGNFRFATPNIKRQLYYPTAKRVACALFDISFNNFIQNLS